MIDLYVCVQGVPSSEEDLGVPGIYLVSVTAQSDPAIHSEIALEIFHQKIGITELDDFDILVYEADGKLLWSDVETDGVDLAKLGEFLGKLGDAEIPPALRK